MRLNGLFVLGMICILSCNQSTNNLHKKMQGLWKLVYFEEYNAQNRKWQLDSQRIGYHGYLLYDGVGHMAIHLTPKDYNYSSSDADSLPLDSLKKQFAYLSTNYVYFGNCLLKDTAVTHTKLSATDTRDIGKKAMRLISFQHDTLCLTTAEKVKGKKLKLSWVMVK